MNQPNSIQLYGNLLYQFPHNPKGITANEYLTFIENIFAFKLKCSKAESNQIFNSIVTWMTNFIDDDLAFMLKMRGVCIFNPNQPEDESYGFNFKNAAFPHEEVYVGEGRWFIKTITNQLNSLSSRFLFSVVEENKNTPYLVQGYRRFVKQHATEAVIVHGVSDNVFDDIPKLHVDTIYDEAALTYVVFFKKNKYLMFNDKQQFIDAVDDLIDKNIFVRGMGVLVTLYNTPEENTPITSFKYLVVQRFNDYE